MKQRWIAGLTAAILLLQFLSLPAAALYEQAGDGSLDLPEVFLEEEATPPAPAVTEAEDEGSIAPMAWTPYQTMNYSYGWNITKSNGNLGDYQNKLRVEVPTEYDGSTSTIQAWLNSWMAGSGIPLSPTTDTATLTFEDLGDPYATRIPDKQFLGWYVFPAASATPLLDNWRYDASCTDAVEPDGPDGATKIITSDFATYPSSVATSYVLPLVARWGDSSNADLRGELTSFYPVKSGAKQETPITAFYTSDISNVNLSEQSAVSFNPEERTEYYLRVPADVTDLSLTLAAFEPYYNYFSSYYATGAAVSNSPVTATVTYGGVANVLTGQFPGGNAAMMPEAETMQVGQNTITIPKNSHTNPARSEWKLNVPLQQCAGAGKLYNDLVITVKSPDGTVTKTFTFHIQRMAEPSLVLNPGNTPFGMIERDTSSFWGATDALRQAAKDYFISNRTFNFAENRYPMDTILNNGGNLTRRSYDKRAWGAHSGAVDYDIDPTAIVVYQDSAFLDPGIKGLTNTLGSPGTVSGTVKRTIALRTADKLTIELVKKDSGTTVYYKAKDGGGGELVSELSSDTLKTENGGGAADVVDLRGLNVLPGIYYIEYTYEDAVTGNTYHSAEGSYLFAPEKAKTFRRAMIVLPLQGDVDMDGMVTAADALALRTLGGMSVSQTQATALNGIAVGQTGANRDAVVDLMFYRVCDVNGDGMVNIGNTSNTGDVLVLQGGYLPRLARSGTSDYYYIPLPDGGATYQRAKLLSEETATAHEGSITMQFLGTQKGTKNGEGFYPSQPEPPNYEPDTVTDGVQQGDIFWVGVRLDDVAKTALAGSGITAFTMSLTYDSNYVKPAIVLQTSDIIAGDSTDMVNLTLLKYNVGGMSNTIWGSGSSYEAPAFGITKARDYQTHYTKAITPLEQNVKSGLQELVFSIQLRDGFSASTLRDGWLLVVPFELTQFPYEEETPVLIEMGAGMREFVFSGTGAMQAYGGMEVHAATTATAAYSGQEKIYGGSTKNLKDTFKYTEGAGVGIPVGEDTAPAARLNNTYVSGMTVNAVYGESYRSRFLGGALQPGDNLPPGMEYGSHTGYTVTGTPTAAGTHTFRVGGTKYEIVVEKANIRFYANSQRSYYGQPQFRGDTEDFTSYYYYVDDIKQVDRNRVDGMTINNDGNGSSLYALLGETVGGFTPPKFRAMDPKTGEAVTLTTPVGTYAVACPETLLPRSKNYTFTFVDTSPTGSVLNVNRLTISPRPVTVTKLTMPDGSYIGEIFDDSYEFLNNIPAVYQADGDKQFELALVTDTGTYGGLPLSGYAYAGSTGGLTISYTAEFVRTDADKLVISIGKKFDIQDPKGWEQREIRVSNINLLADEDGMAGNYQFIQPSGGKPSGTQDPPIYGKVKAQTISRIEFVRTPASMSYSYGDFLGDSSFSFKLTYTSQTVKDNIVLSQTNWELYRVTPIWLTYDEMVAARDNPQKPLDHENTTGQDAIGSAANFLNYSERLTVEKHNGRYLCISIPTFVEDTEEVIYIRAFSEPLSVSKRTLTLTARPVARYYGEPNPTAAYTFTYNTAELAVFDRQTGDRGNAGELTRLAGYVAPTLTAQLTLNGGTGDANLIKQTTSASSSDYFLVIEGASSANYDFRYATGTGGSTSATRGYSAFTIQRRPIVVTTIHSSISAATQTGLVNGVVLTSAQTGATGVDLAEVYADTGELVVRPTNDNNNTKYNGNVLSLSAEEFSVALPEHDATGTRYYPKGGSGSSPLSSTLTFADGAAAVLDEDKAGLSLRYTATFVPEKAFHNGLADNYFDMSEANAATGERYCDVQVSDIELSGAAAANYLLVYSRNADAISGYPAGRVPKLAPQIGMFDAPTVYYYVSGHGVLHTRPISAITIVTLPQMTYTYGDQFSPDKPMQGARNPLTIQVDYATQYDNSVSNETGERLEFIGYGYDTDGVLLSNFRERGMEIRFMPAGVSDKANSVVIEPGQYLTHAEHNGKNILIAGKRSDRDDMVYSNSSGTPLTINKKNLPITVQNQYRYYGERNGNYTFTFLRSDLAVPDRGWLAGATGSGWATVSTDGAATNLQATEGDLKGKGGYVGPGFTTAAQKTSEVQNGGATPYDLTLSGGSMDNYTLVPSAPGKIYVYRRPIRVDSIVSNEGNPIYTVYSDTSERVFETDATLTSVGTKLPVASGQSYNNSSDPEFQKSPNSNQGRPLSGSAVLPGDNLTFNLQVTYPDYNSSDLQQGVSVSMNVKVTGVTLNATVGAGKNYALIPNTYDLSAKGEVELRSIKSIKLSQAVQKTSYQYPESLDLSGLLVEITYASLSGEQDKVETVQYIGTAQFASYGLYLRYHGSPTPPTGNAIGDLYQTGRIAETGDHLTIAPTQDTQGRAEFTPNGKYIAVLARRHEDQTFADSILANPNAPIQVAPLTIRFSLLAGDKTYDGNTEAVGTLIMSNIYNESTVDRYHPSGVTDIVFVRTGAANQTPVGYDADDHRGFTAFKSAVSSEGYRFVSGTYERDEQNRLDDHLSFTGGAYGGVANDRLTFTFVDPNVAYQTPPTHDNYGPLATIAVEASNLILDGPDAANYTLVTHVDSDNYTTATGYQGGALPRATIFKAARPDLTSILTDGGQSALAARLPDVVVDEHTNAVQMGYDMEIEPFYYDFDDYKEENHFEYALQYDRSDGTAAVGQWAGNVGADPYQDKRFFGGEFASVKVPEGYLANPNDIPTEYDPERDILRGQIYGWSGVDPDIAIDEEAYLRAMMEDGELNEIPYPTYEVYKIIRDPLPRDTVFWGLVRLAETHNYEASPALSSVDGLDYTKTVAEAAATEALNIAIDAYSKGQITEDALNAAKQAAAAAAEAVLGATADAVQDAKDAARARDDILTLIAEDGKWPEDGLPPIVPAPAIKTFRQRFDLVSTSTQRSYGVSNSEEYVVPRLEAVWFTNILIYPEKRLLDAVLRNIEKTRYYQYYWDSEFTAQVDTDNRQVPLDLTGPLEVEVTLRNGGQNEKTMITVNTEPVGGIETVNTALIYVDINPPNSGELRGLHIIPETVEARLGDAPFQLTPVFNPADVHRKTLQWVSSDETVVTVSGTGLLTFVGVGTATITATAFDGKTATVFVTVTDEVIDSAEQWHEAMLERYPDTIFNFAATEPFFSVDENNLFYPERQMTRGELAMFLLQFYRENVNRPVGAPVDFPDLTGDEAYYEAARTMGALGLMNGVDGGFFAGERLVTRAELAAILVRMILGEVPDTRGNLHAFLDTGEADTWAYAYIDALARVGILQGVGDGYFAPDRVLTRAEAAAMIDRLLYRMSQADGRFAIIPSDIIEDSWAYFPILRAVNGREAEADTETQEDVPTEDAKSE